jgi:hypothetical protein
MGIRSSRTWQSLIAYPSTYLSLSGLHRCPIGEHYTELPLVTVLFYHKFRLSVQSEQSEWKVWNFRYGDGQLSDFAAKSRRKAANLMDCILVSVP